MTVIELHDFYDQRFRQCFRAYFLEIGIRLKEDTDVFDEITRTHTQEGMRAFAIVREEQFAGFIMLQPEHFKSGFFEERAGFIRELWVAPAFRGQGCGRQLLEVAREHFLGLGIHKLILTYEAEALGFYTRLGFHPDASYTAKNNGRVIVKYI